MNLRFAIVIVFFLFANSANAQFRPGIERKTIREDSLQGGDSTTNVEINSFISEKKAFLKNEVAFGGTAGTPGILNFIAEGYLNRFGLRLEAGGIFFLGFVAGWQSDISYVFVRGDQALLECSAIFYRNVVESFDAGDSKYNTGAGIGLGVNASGFFFQLGIGHVYSRDPQIQVINSPALINAWPMTVQFGYVH